MPNTDKQESRLEIVASSPGSLFYCIALLCSAAKRLNSIDYGAMIKKSQKEWIPIFGVYCQANIISVHWHAHVHVLCMYECIPERLSAGDIDINIVQE